MKKFLKENSWVWFALLEVVILILFAMDGCTWRV